MRTFLFLSLLLLATGCTHTVTEEQLYAQAEIARGDTMGQAYYLGRSRGYDYFQIYWNVGSTRFRVQVPNAIIDKPQPLSASARKMDIHSGGLMPYSVLDADPNGLLISPDPLANPDLYESPDPYFLPDYFIGLFGKPLEDDPGVVPGEH